jgi:hypothetical protein
MSGKYRVGRGSAVVGVALWASISGCASNIEGAQVPPVDWVAEAPSSQCAALAGHYSAAGMPAATNANTSGYGAVWAKEGSLLSIIELGANRTPRKRPRPDPFVHPRDVLPSIGIAIDPSGRPEFEARNASGAHETLTPQVWRCEGGALTTRVDLSTPDFESHVRLWKHGNALVAEQTVRLKAHEPVARFYFRFPSTTD